MGCSTSKLDSQEVVQLCKDRKMFVEQAVEYRARFSADHNAYIESMRRVSSALRYCIEGEEYSGFLVDAFTTPAFTPVKKINSGFIPISSKSLLHSEKNSSLQVNFCKSSGNGSISVEEKPPSPEIVRVEAYSPANHNGIDGFFTMHSVPISSSFYQCSPNNMPSFPSPLQQTTQWDSFWDPFSSLDYYGYPATNSLDQMILDDNNEISQVQKVEDKSAQTLQSSTKDEIVIEDVKDDDNGSDKINGETDSHHLSKELQPDADDKVVANTENKGELCSKETTVADCEAKEIPGFTVYVNTGPTNMAEAIKDLEAQFIIACNSAKEVSAMLDSTNAQNPSISKYRASATKMLSPVALFRSGSSRSLSSKFSVNPLIEDDCCQTSGEFFDDSRSCGSLQSTLDRLHLWESKLFQEVRAGERVRLAYEKKCAQLKNQEENKADISLTDKTRAAIGDLFARIKVSIHSVEAISKRIETLRDEELYPHILKLMQGIGQMWKVMAECHQLQKCTLDASKHSALNPKTPPSEQQQLGRSAANLETELRNWRACFESWIISQRSYMHSLTGWLFCYIRANPIPSKLQPLSPCFSMGAPPIFSICIQWSRLLDTIDEAPVIDGLDFFVVGLGSLCAHHLREDPNRAKECSNKDTEEAEKAVEAAIGVVYSGMSVCVSALAEFAVDSAQGYADLLKNWEDKLHKVPRES